MTKLESRPARSGLWEYVFFVDLEGHRDDASVAAALAELHEKAAFLKILGSYPVSVSVSVIMNLCDLSPHYVRAIAPYQPGKPIAELARELGLAEHRHRQAGVQRKPARRQPQGAGSDRKRACMTSRVIRMATALS